MRFSLIAVRNGRHVARGRVEALADNAVRITVRLPYNSGHRWTAGQHYFVNFFKVRPLESHPYTVANAPRNDPSSVVRPLLHAVTPPAHLADLSTRARRPRRTASSSSSASTLSRASVPASSRSPRPRPRLRPSSSTARTAVLPPRTATLAGTTRSSSSPAAPACPSARPSSRRSAAGSCARRRASGSRRSTCGGLSGTRVRALSCRPRPRRARLTRSLTLARRGEDVVRQPDPPRDRVPAPRLRHVPPVRHRRAAVGRVEGETRPGGRAVAALQRRRQVRAASSYPRSLLRPPR